MPWQTIIPILDALAYLSGPGHKKKQNIPVQVLTLKFSVLTDYQINIPVQVQVLTLKFSVLTDHQINIPVQVQVLTLKFSVLTDYQINIPVQVQVLTLKFSVLTDHQINIPVQVQVLTLKFSVLTDHQIIGYHMIHPGMKNKAPFNWKIERYVHLQTSRKFLQLTRHFCTLVEI